MSKSVCTPTFGEISQSTAELFLLPVCENGRPLYWNATSGFDFDLFIVMSMASCIGVPHFIQIGQRTGGVELGHDIAFFKIAAIESKIYSGASVLVSALV